MTAGPSTVSDIDGLLAALTRLAGEDYKRALGTLLAHGLTANRFDYPEGRWPPPSPARRYIRRFLDLYRDRVRGRCVEFHPAHYRELFESAAIESYDVWNLEAGPGVTFVADLMEPPPSGAPRFDTIVCTHVLSAVPDVRRAVQTLHSLLEPGGLLLITVPVVLQKFAPHPSDCWRITTDGLRSVLDGFSRVECHAYGNAATAAGSPFFLMEEHFPPAILDADDPACPSIVAAGAWK